MTESTVTLEQVCECTRLARAVQQVGDRAREENRDSAANHETMSGILKEFHARFAEFQAALDALGLPGQIPVAGLAPGLSEAIGELIETMKDLLETHKQIIPMVQALGGQTGEKLGLIRQARGIFQKFVRPADDREPKFFDKKG